MTPKSDTYSVLQNAVEQPSNAELIDFVELIIMNYNELRKIMPRIARDRPKNVGVLSRTGKQQIGSFGVKPCNIGR